MTHSPSTFVPEIAPQIADAVTAMPGVARLHGGVFGELTTFLLPDVVRGISFNDATQHVEVGVVAAWPVNVPRLAAAIRKVVASFATNPVDVYINDVELPGEEVSSVPSPAVSHTAPDTNPANPAGSR